MEMGIADHGCKFLPDALLTLFGHCDGEIGLLSFDFSLQNIGRVGLTNIGELAGGLDSILS